MGLGLSPNCGDKLPEVEQNIKFVQNSDFNLNTGVVDDRKRMSYIHHSVEGE
jgi:hypothetical protein